MENKISKIILFTVIVASVLPVSYAKGLKEDEVLQKVGFEQRLNNSLPLDAFYVDETGRQVKLRDYFGKKPVILTLVYYECPMLCTLSLNGLVKALRALSFDVGKQFDVLTISFDAREKSNLAAAKKKTYIQEYNRPSGNQGWHFLTGNQPEIDRLTEAVGFHYAFDPETKQFAHPTGVIVITPQGIISRYFFDIEYSTLDLKMALLEAADGKIGTPLDKAILYCYHYDPTTGRYGFVILRLMQGACLLTVAILAFFVLLMLHREKNSRHA